MAALDGSCMLAISIIIIVTVSAQLPPSPGNDLTAMIKQNRTEEARNASSVDAKHFLNITSHSGFLTVDERYSSNLFFWYFPHWNIAGDRPWIIWLQGGPGASSLAGLFDELGPFQYDATKQNLKSRDSAWTKEYSVLFIDNPVGAGFSYTMDELGYARSMDMYTENLYEALHQFLAMFPELRRAPLYIAGESYAGHYVPAFAKEILDRKKIGKDDVNLQGILLGNPVLERENIVNISRIFYEWGLIDSQGLAAIRPEQDTYRDAVRREDARAARDARDALLNRLSEITNQKQNYNVLDDELSFYDFEDYLRRPDVRRALHVDTKGRSVNADVVEKLIPEFLSHMRPIVEELLEHFKVLIYCGQLDLTAPCTPNAEARRRKWHWSRKDRFMQAQRIPWVYNGSVAGYVKSGGGLTEVLVRGAGHLVPMDKGPQTLDLITRFIGDQPYPKSPDFEERAEYVREIIYDPIESSSSGFKTVMIVSLLFNVLLVCGVIGGVWYYRVRMRRCDNYMLSSQSESVLSLEV